MGREISEISEEMPPESRGLWVLVLEPRPGPVPAVVRMRALLKRALRDLGIVCVAARDHQPGDPAPGEFDVKSGKSAKAKRSKQPPALAGCD